MTIKAKKQAGVEGVEGVAGAEAFSRLAISE